MKVYLRRMKTKTLCPEKKSRKQILWSWLGSFAGIYLLSILSREYTLFLIGSFGATAVLIYGAPDSDFAQPRNLLGGHIFSAIIGIITFKLFHSDLPLACALAVSLAIVIMHFTRTMHPPGGATALIAVIGGTKVTNLGFSFVVYPVAPGALAMLFVAILVNNFSRDSLRHYPKYWL